jgi:hypothetical protein
MAGRKLSAKTEEEVVFMENLLMQCATLMRKVEEYGASKKNTESQVQSIVRELAFIRQKAMMKNLGMIADAAGGLSMQAGRGSQTQRTRVLRDGVITFKQLIERVIKATIDADARVRHENEEAMAKAKATT